jgi:hypothetical protein
VIPTDRFLTSEDMARIYCISDARVFMQRFDRDRKLPKELRMIPDPINKRSGHGVRYLWSPEAVNSFMSRGVAKGAK